MPYLPLHIDMGRRLAVVVGGGAVALRKTAALLDVGARVHVVAPELDPGLSVLVAAARITVRSGCYEPADLSGAFLVIAATDDRETNSLVARDADGLGILSVVADVPPEGNCIFPARLERGRLEISVSTGGGCPGFAARVRDLIAELIDERYGHALEQLALEREKLLTEGKGSTYNTKVMHSLVREAIGQLTHKERLP